MGAATDAGTCAAADEDTIMVGAGAADIGARPASPSGENDPGFQSSELALIASRQFRFCFRAAFASDYSRPISTAMRIRSEWLFAPSFCFSKEVVLATVL